MLPTLADVLALPALRRGEPRVLAADGGLQRPVRWVHVAEVTDIAHLLEGGELILTTGIALPDTSAALGRYVRDLEAIGVAALVVELGRRYRDTLPDGLVRAAERVGLPLVELRRETPFVAVTQAVHTLILAARTQELIASEEAHTAFTELTIAGHGPQQVVDLVASMSGRPVVYENLMHQVLAHNGAGRDLTAVLDDWERRSRVAGLGAARESGERLRVEVGAPGGGSWGHLVMLCDDGPTTRDRMLLERGATALVINRLTVRDLDSLERHTHRTLLTALAFARVVPAEAAARSRALGVPLDRRSLSGVVVLPVDERDDDAMHASLLRDLATQAVTVLESMKVPALVGPLDDQRLALLLSLDRASDVDRVLTALSIRLHAATDRWLGTRLVIASGNPVDGAERAQHTVREAMRVADTARELSEQRGYFRPPDLRLRGLVWALREEPALQDYVEHELRQLLAHDAAHGSRLYEFVAAYCAAAGNKTAAAESLYISRAALYDRIAKVERVLGVDLGDPETVLALHFAVLAREGMRRADVVLRP
jgi:purine catabolism regulator